MVEFKKPRPYRHVLAKERMRKEQEGDEKTKMKCNECKQKFGSEEGYYHIQVKANGHRKVLHSFKLCRLCYEKSEKRRLTNEI